MDYPNSVVLHFPESVYQNVGSSAVLPRLLEIVGAEKLSTVQFLQRGRVRLTFKDCVSCDELIASGLVYNGVQVRVFRADSRICSVYVRDLPSEISDDDVHAFLQSYGDVLSVRRSTFPNFPALYNGNRELALKDDIPYSVRICDCNCRVWYARQPVYCNICRQAGHCPSACALSGLCRRCRQPSHMARECQQAWSTVRLTSTDDDDDTSPDYVPPTEEAPSEASENLDDQVMSGDEEVVATAPPPPSPRVSVSVSVSDAPPAASDVPAPTPSSVPVSTPPPSFPAPSSVPVSDDPYSDVDSRFITTVRNLSTEDLAAASQQRLNELVDRLLEKFSIRSPIRRVYLNFVFDEQRRARRIENARKQSLKRQPVKLPESEGPPSRKPTRPDRVPSK